jgi:hypothetical protein
VLDPRCLVMSPGLSPGCLPERLVAVGDVEQTLVEWVSPREAREQNAKRVCNTLILNATSTRKAHKIDFNIAHCASRAQHNLATATPCIKVTDHRPSRLWLCPATWLLVLVHYGATGTYKDTSGCVSQPRQRLGTFVHIAAPQQIQPGSWRVCVPGGVPHRLVGFPNRVAAAICPQVVHCRQNSTQRNERWGHSCRCLNLCLLRFAGPALWF